MWVIRRFGRVANAVNLLIGLNLHDRVARPAFFWRDRGLLTFTDHWRSAIPGYFVLPFLEFWWLLKFPRPHDFS